MARPKLEPLNLGSIARGALLEYFEMGSCQVAENIADPNTSSTATRTVVLTIKFKPEGTDRRAVRVTCSCATKTAAPAEHNSLVFTGKDTGGKTHLFDEDPRQDVLFDPPAEDENLLDFKKSGT
jgi:hypothetical protein